MVLALLQKGFAVECTSSDAQALPGVGEAVLMFGAATPGEQTKAGPVLRRPGMYFQDISGLSVQAIVALAEDWRVQITGSSPGQWLPWFPVIDYDRCTHCMQCLSFCLFGVFGVDAQQHLEVSLSENCKPNCPACSRVCPEAAIIFPKYKTAPINGEEISEPELQREKMKIDVSALLGGDLYEVLRERSQRAQSRFSKDRDPDKALQERQKCLARLAQAADIPPEVLMALPSADEIERKAREARAKAQKILGNGDKPESL